MSKTPRTEEQILHHDNGNGHPSDFVFASFARQLETELAEARAEIERLMLEVENKQYTVLCAAQEIDDLRELLAEARAEIEMLRARNAILDNTIVEMTEEQAELRAAEEIITLLVEAKDKRIEQMRRAIEKVKSDFRVNLRDLTEFEEKQVKILEAALAAERGEG